MVTLLKTHDEKALKSLFELYHTSLCLLAYTIVKDNDQAKDIVQDVFIKLWKNRMSLEITSSLNAYLKRATVNSSINFIESGYVKNKHRLEKSNLTFYSRNTADQELTYDELKKRADDSIQNLPIRTRGVFTLIRSDEMTYKEVAETLGISVKAVEKEMMKALKLLREALKDYLPSFMLLLANTLL